MESASLDRFRAELDRLIAPDARIGVGVSGGPDSRALLLLAVATRPGRIEAATVDHAFRDESRTEAESVARLCAELGVPHAILTARWSERPSSAIQERARAERYRLLGYWAEERRLDALATGHHADDQAETFFMRLARGAGVRGLGGMHPRSLAPGTDVALLRPLLGWRRHELEQVCAGNGIAPAADPSNEDERFERVRVRRALAQCGLVDPAAVARSAACLGEADKALDWAARRTWSETVRDKGDAIAFRPDGAPREILRRIVARAIRRLASEGGPDFRGGELDRLLATLAEGGTATLRGVLCEGGREWRFISAPKRR